VDDDDAVRATLKALLTEAGYDVATAATGQEAVAVIESGCPDLLLSDLVMPEPNGQALANLCRERCPNTLLVLMSGYSEEELHDLNIKQVVFIPKPIHPEHLRMVIGRLLRSPDPSR
jgi:CheY-like chemotaxis protein